jgi:hypothetical protein
MREGTEGDLEVRLYRFFDLGARWGGYFPIRAMLKETSHVPFSMDLRRLWLGGFPREVKFLCDNFYFNQHMHYNFVVIYTPTYVSTTY